MGGLGRVWRVCNFMTQTQPQSVIKFFFITQPNPTHQALKTDPTRRVRSGLVGRWVFYTLLAMS